MNRLRRLAMFGMIVCLFLLSVSAQAAVNDWDCPVCGKKANFRKYCGECGTEQPAIVLSYDMEPGALKAKDTVEFGSYEQDGNAENGKEPIRWIVVGINGTGKNAKALLLSEYGLDVQKYEGDSDRYKDPWHHAAWDKCQLEKWLNQDFLEEAFDGKERNILYPVMLDEYGTADAHLKERDESALQFVFLLSEADLNSEEWALSREQKSCQPTEYAISRGAFTGDTQKSLVRCWWWLRGWKRLEPIQNNRREPAKQPGPRVVDLNGDLIYYGAYNEHVAVRPACWIDLGALNSLK